MSDTPETDAFSIPHRGLGTGYYQALEHSRKLERLLNAAIADRDKWVHELDRYQMSILNQCEAAGFEGWRDAMEKAIAFRNERDELARKLDITKNALCPPSRSVSDKEPRIAIRAWRKRAIEAVKVINQPYVAPTEGL